MLHLVLALDLGVYILFSLESPYFNLSLMLFWGISHSAFQLSLFNLSPKHILFQEAPEGAYILPFIIIQTIL